MNIKYLAVDSDIELAESEAAVWKETRGIGMERVDNMTEGIQKLLTGEYLYVGINGDAIDFMPLLQTMRSVTNAPILIAVNSFTTEAEVAALENGADLYARWHKDTKGNIASVLAHITQLSTRGKIPRPSSKVIVYDDLLIAPLQRRVFVGNEKIDLTRQEFDLIYYLTANHGMVLTYKQIYKHVWGKGYEDSERDVLRNAIKRLREKLKDDTGCSKYIKTVLDYGYSFPLYADK
jgi:DNA-binding response OmpR family regulator